MVFAAGSFSDDLGIGPTQTAKVNGHGNARQPRGRGGTTTFADRDLIRDFERQWGKRSSCGLQHLAVGIQNEVVFHFSTNFGVASACGDGKFFGRTSVNLDVEVHRDGRRVEGRSEIGGRGRERQAKPRAFRVWSFAAHLQF